MHGQERLSPDYPEFQRREFQKGNIIRNESQVYRIHSEKRPLDQNSVSQILLGQGTFPLKNYEGCCLSSWAAITKCHKLGGLNYYKTVSHISGGCEIPDQDASTFSSCSGRQTPSIWVLTWQRERGFCTLFLFL